MAGRNKLSEEEKLARQREKEELLSTRRKYKKRNESNSTEETHHNMADENKDINNENNAGGGNDNNQGGGENNNNNNAGNENNNQNQGGGGENNTNQGGANENLGGANENLGGGNDNTIDASKYTANKDWKPFKGKRIERSYSTPKIDPALVNTVIPEQNINIETNSMNVEKAENLLNKPANNDPTNPVTNSNGQPVPKKIEPVNSEWNNMSPDEQRTAAESAADMMLGVYDKLHYFGRQYIKVDEQEIIEMHEDDKIDMHAATVDNDEDPDKEVTIEQFWQDFNKQVDERFIVSQKFKDDVRPPLVRICTKYGLGASDGLYLGYKFTEDAATKVAMLVGFKKTVNKMNEHFMKRHDKFKAAVEAEVQKRMAKTTPKKEEKPIVEENKDTTAAHVDQTKKPAHIKTDENTTKQKEDNNNTDQS